MDDAYRVRLMPVAERAYRSLRLTSELAPADPLSPSFPIWKSTNEHLGRVNSILRSLRDPNDVYLDERLLARMSWLLTRSIDSTLVYYLRLEETRSVRVLHITQFDSTNAYARFWTLMNEGGCEVLAALGVEVPIDNIGISTRLQ